MPLDPPFRTILDTLESSGLTPLIRGDAAQTRAHYRTLSLSRRGPGFVPEEVASVGDLRSPGGVPVRVYEPASPGGFTLIYLHGGGWVVGDVETHDPLCRRVANRTGARVVSVDYRLAPEHPYPAAVEDAWAATQWVGANTASLGADPDRLAVAVDSAAGNLAPGMEQLAPDAGGPPIRFQLPWYPATTWDTSLPSFTGPAASFAPDSRFPSGIRSDAAT